MIPRECHGSRNESPTWQNMLIPSCVFYWALSSWGLPALECRQTQYRSHYNIAQILRGISSKNQVEIHRVTSFSTPLILSYSTGQILDTGMVRWLLDSFPFIPPYNPTNLWFKDTTSCLERFPPALFFIMLPPEKKFLAHRIGLPWTLIMHTCFVFKFSCRRILRDVGTSPWLPTDRSRFCISTEVVQQNSSEVQWTVKISCCGER